jgi:hypothetical protein
MKKRRRGRSTGGISGNGNGTGRAMMKKRIGGKVPGLSARGKPGAVIVMNLLLSS